MSQNNLGVVYDLTDGQVRRVIDPDDDNQLNSVTFHSAANNEGFIQIEKAKVPSLEAIQSAVYEVTGIVNDGGQ